MLEIHIKDKGTSMDTLVSVEGFVLSAGGLDSVVYSTQFVYKFNKSSEPKILLGELFFLFFSFFIKKKNLFFTLSCAPSRPSWSCLELRAWQGYTKRWRLGKGPKRSRAHRVGICERLHRKAQPAERGGGSGLFEQQGHPARVLHHFLDGLPGLWEASTRYSATSQALRRWECRQSHQWNRQPFAYVSFLFSLSLSLLGRGSFYPPLSVGILTSLESVFQSYQRFVTKGDSFELASRFNLMRKVCYSFFLLLFFLRWPQKNFMSFL